MNDNTLYTASPQMSGSGDAEKIDLFRIFSDMWKGVKIFWWLPLAAALLVGILSYVRADRSYTPYYETSATVYVNMASGKRESGGQS